MVYRVGVQPLYCWDRRFESRLEHGRSSVVFVVCCAGSGIGDDLTTRSGVLQRERERERERVCNWVWSRNL